jgi:hypothetical protein
MGDTAIEEAFGSNMSRQFHAPMGDSSTIRQAPADVEVDLTELELDSGVAVARWVDELRARVRAHGRIRVRGCPQMLAHTLYKANLLRDGSIELVDVREEEPYG